jgi:glutamate dehydrogenase/leucine dehydrogenase
MTKLDPTDSIEALAERLRALGSRRASFIYDPDSGCLRASRPELDAIARSITSNVRDFAGHEAVFLELGESTGALMTAFIHRTTRGQGAGGVRHWPYASLSELLDDGLRLSRGMGRKSALAGLWWGGAKGIIARQADADLEAPEYRRRLYRDYGSFVASLRGVYVTAEDVGTRATDMAALHETTRFVTCIPTKMGGSGNPSGATAQGVVCAMEAALIWSGNGRLDGKTIAMQGAGNVAGFMIGDLLRRNVARIITTDISEPALSALRERYADPRLEARLSAVDDLSIFETVCDLFAPNALGGVLTPRTIPKLRTKIVCGAANNQLLDDARDSRALDERGIAFVPDFVANRMGIVQCANEQYGTLPNDPAIARHFDPSWEDSVQSVTQRVLTRAAEDGCPPTQAANALADELSEQNHPLWPHRGARIIAALERERWHEEG